MLSYRVNPPQLTRRLCGHWLSDIANLITAGTSRDGDWTVLGGRDLELEELLVSPCEE